MNSEINKIGLGAPFQNPNGKNLDLHLNPKSGF